MSCLGKNDPAIGGSLAIRGGYIFIPGKSMMAPIYDVTGLRFLQRVKEDVTLFDDRQARGQREATGALDGYRRR